MRDAPMPSLIFIQVVYFLFFILVSWSGIGESFSRLKQVNICKSENIKLFPNSSVIYMS